MIAAYGLSGTAEHFAKAPEADVKKAIDEAKSKPAANKVEDKPPPSASEARAGEAAAPAKTAGGGAAKPSKMKATMVGESPMLAPAAVAAAKAKASDDAGRATVPTGTRASSLPPLPRTGLDGKTIAIVALGVLLACGLLALMLR